MKITVTARLLQLVDDAQGFDNYILRTPIEDFKSQLALDLRRQMLIALAKRDYHQNNPDKHRYVLEKYKDVTLPVSSVCIAYSESYKIYHFL